MLEVPNWRATLLAGTCLALFAGPPSSHADTRSRHPAYIVQEPAWKPRELPPVTTRHIYYFDDVPPRYRLWRGPEARPSKNKPPKAKPAKIKPAKVAPIEIEPVTARPLAIEKPLPVTSARSDAAKDVAKRDFATERKQDKRAAVPAGPLHVIVSVNEQRASLYANGTFVASTKVSTGTKSHPTPLGVFSVIQKNRHHVSNLYGAPMPYMQRLTWSGTAMHTGPLPGYPASHGCIRLTNDFAQMLWKATKIGARVIVARDDVKPVEISHARLELPAAAPAMASAADKATETTGSLVRTADAAGALGVAPIAINPALTGPVSIFISRKDAKLYVRQAMQPLFDMPLTLHDPARPIGTHVYTVMEVKDGAMRWNAVSIPSGDQRKIVKTEKTVRKGRKTRTETIVTFVDAVIPGAGDALDRIEIPQEALDRLAGKITPGSSLIVSDNGLSHETGKGTDFIVLTQ